MDRADDFDALYGPDERDAIDAWVGLRELAPPSTGGPAAWRRTSAGGAVVAAMLLGLREVFDPPPDEEVVLVVDADGEPHDPDAPVVVDFDPEAPAGTTATLRLWVVRPPTG